MGVLVERIDIDVFELLEQDFERRELLEDPPDPFGNGDPLCLRCHFGPSCPGGDNCLRTGDQQFN